MTGGDLQFYLNKYGMFAEKVARFYMCEIILGLQHLHDNNIVHRDIKVCIIYSTMYMHTYVHIVHFLMLSYESIKLFLST